MVREIKLEEQALEVALLPVCGPSYFFRVSFFPLRFRLILILSCQSFFGEQKAG